MALSNEAKERLSDIVELQPTKNADLAERWGLDGGSEVHRYLESELRDYYYRDENSLIRATVKGITLVGGEVPEEARTVTISPFESRVLDVLAGPDERTESVVSVLHTFREAFDEDPPVEEVRRALQRLRRAGLVTVEYRTVPTFRLAADRDSLAIEVRADDAPAE